MARLLAIALCVVAAAAFADEAALPDAVDPGPNFPEVGRSLFDYLVSDISASATTDGDGRYRVPFPFEALTAAIEARLGGADGIIAKTLFPLGRSLQREGGAPDYFRYPRAVVAVVGEGQGPRGMLLADRLYLGYQERANLIEVISYNEEAGRFEFQLVRDYSPGQTPKVVYTDRRVCAACHQSLSPIFSRPPWSETPATRPIRELLLHEAESFHGISPRHGEGVVSTVDDATNRAGLYSVYQSLWQAGCGALLAPEAAACRGHALLAALQFRLSGERYNRDAEPNPGRDLAKELQHAWPRAFPDGLEIPDVDLPNRDPIGDLRPSLGRPLRRSEFGSETAKGREELKRLATVDSYLEPSRSRAPREVWTSLDVPSRRWDEIIVGLSRFFAKEDIATLDRRLFALGFDSGSAMLEASAPCSLWPGLREATRSSYKLECRSAPDADPKLTVLGVLDVASGQVRKGVIRSIRFGELGHLTNLRVHPSEGEDAVLTAYERGSGLHARFPQGDAIRDLSLGIDLDRGDGSSSVMRGRLRVRVQRDFAFLSAAVESLKKEDDDVLSGKPLRRMRIMAALNRQLAIPQPDWCCLGTAGMPPMRFEAP